MATVTDGHRPAGLASAVSSWLRRKTGRMLRGWRTRSLAAQFMLAGSAVSLMALVVVGYIVTSAIEASVTRNTAAATALYVDSVIAPLLPDMRREAALDDSVSRALDETLRHGALGQRLVSFRLWHRDGTILYAVDKEQVGKRYVPNSKLLAAFSGQLVAEFELPEDEESASERALGTPLLEIYSPVLQPWSGEVVAVSEFYEAAADFEESLHRALLVSWAAVATAVLGFFAALFSIVLRGSRVIDSQKNALRGRVDQLTDLLEQNDALRQRLERSSARAAALNESYLRRIGADLHDGPAQSIALASLRLDSRALTASRAATADRSREISSIRACLDEAMSEIRTICNGLVLPQVENADLPEIIRLAVRAHEERSNVRVALSIDGTCPPLSIARKTCVYRFLQETLNNGYRHAGGSGQSVILVCADTEFRLEVTDTGPGFEPEAIRPGALGLKGLRERIRSLGGRFDIQPSINGTRVTMTLPADETSA